MRPHLTLAGLLPLLPSIASAKPANARQASQGIDEEKVVWDISMSEPRMLAARLSVIKETYDDLGEHGVEPDMVLTFHGKTVRYPTDGKEDVPLETHAQVDRVNAALDQLLALEGARGEVCGRATRLLGADNDDVRSDLEVVRNSWISVIDYEKQGYTVVDVK
ncbi:MAG: DsrE family protein [Gammaproteobacteria bacterium]|nr:DsrE family protein [Gammaproteobacteria bacterium]